MEVLGADPGLNGAIASWDGQQLFVIIVPVFEAAKRGKEIDWSVLASDVAITFPHAAHVFIERVHSRPGEGVSSAFKFGFNAGGLRGMFAAMGKPITYVGPAVWKKALGLSAAKDPAVALASQLFPNDAAFFRGPKGGLRDGPAEAALIAYYGYEKLNGRMK